MASMQGEVLGPAATPTAQAESADSSIASVPQWRLMARRFRKSKLAVISVAILAILYLGALFAPFFSPNQYEVQDANQKWASPSSWTWNGGPALCGRTQSLNKATFTYEYKNDCNKAVGVHFFGHGYEYKVLGLFNTHVHFMTVDSPNKMLLWGADSQGRDIFSRTAQGARVSLTIGIVGVLIGTILGATIGTVSGYYRGKIDTALQRFIEIIMSIPTLPLWLVLAAILPRDMSVVSRYFFISLILSLVSWAGLARQIRGKVLSYSQSDYVAAARAAGSSGRRVIFTHMLPNAMSHIVATAMLAIPASIIAETSLSFLGVGMLPPAVSWGVLLKDGQQISVIQQYPWLLLPAAVVVLAVSCYLLVGDALRDAVDPYST